jgi:uncharacterized protein (TIRG00374 family)
MTERTRSFLYLVLRIAASALLMSVLLWQVDFAHIAALFARAKPFPLFLGLCAWFCVLSLSNERWRKLLGAQGIDIPFFRLLSIYMISFFFNNFLPAGLGMDITRTVYVAKQRGRASEVFASVLAERVLGMVGILIFALFALLFYLNTHEGRMIALLVGGLTLVVLVAVILFLKRGFLPPLRRRIGAIKLFRLGERIKKLYEALQLYRKSLRPVLWAVFLSILVQGFLVLLNFASGTSLGLEVPLYSHLVYVPIISIIAMIPISINGIGVREWGYVFFFGLVGLTRGEALSMSLLFFAIGIVGSLTGGIAFLFRSR